MDTDISRPDPTKINQYVVTSADVAGTGYGNHFIANIDWEFRVRAINGRAPAKAMNTDISKVASTSVESPAECVLSQKAGQPLSKPRPAQMWR